MECIKCKKTIPEDGLYCPYCGKKQSATPKKAKKRVNGMGSIIKKPGKRTKPWEAQKAGVYVGCYATKFEAEQALAKLADTPMSESFNMTFTQIYEKWKPTHSKKLTESGVSGYEFAYKHCEELHDRIFRKLRTSDFQSVINNMEAMGLSKSSCGKVVQLFGQLSKWAIQEEICHTNYAKYVYVADSETKVKQVFSDAQIKAIQKSSAVGADIALILIATGCRPNELFKVTVDNCYGSYFISGSKTETGKNRVIPVTSIGLVAYQKLLKTAKETNCELLIGAYGGNKEYRNYAKRDWKALMEEIGAVGISPYSCRHTYATLAVKAGIRSEILQKIMGHADYNTTLGVYTHLDIAEILEESQKLDVTDTLQTNKKSATDFP